MKLKSNPLLSEQKIQARILELAKRINQDYAGKTLLVVGVLRGSFVFIADLVRKLDLDLRIEFIGVSSYQGTQSTGHVQLTQDLSVDIQGCHVLLVEDIVDTGRTLHYLIDALRLRNPASIEVCACLSKPSCRVIEVDVQYVGFEIEDRFVVGYGLDYNGKWRQLPDIIEVES